MSEALRKKLEASAQSLGFDRFGVAEVTPLVRESEALHAWLREGHHASMAWMERNVEVRAQIDHEMLHPEAKSVIALAVSVARLNEGDIGPAPGVVARYARGRDYHNVMGKRAQKLAALLRDAGFTARSTVDTAPVLERAWAERAGLGFVGKNTMLIIPGLGSHVMLACVVTNAVLPHDAPIGERCGSCTRCLDRCPTQAFPSERVLDSRRCVSYLTIEHEGPVEESLREGIGHWFLGCDVCQDVCPFNQTKHVALGMAKELAPHPRWNTSAEQILRMSEADFDTFSMGSPVRRPGYASALRNAAIVLGNAGQKTHLRVLDEVAVGHADEVVREAAGWGRERLKQRLGDPESG